MCYVDCEWNANVSVGNADESVIVIKVISHSSPLRCGERYFFIIILSVLSILSIISISITIIINELSAVFV